MLPFTPDEPVLQVQAVSFELPSAELELIGHAEQTVSENAAGAVEYLPTPQSMQTSDTDPVAVEYLPGTQKLHSALPVTALYSPAKQAIHSAGAPSDPV